MTARLAPHWQVAPEDITVRWRRLPATPTARRPAPSRRSPTSSSAAGPGLTVSGSVNAGFLQGGGFAHHIVDVEVDPETGKVTILRYTAIQDVGTAIHPAYVEGQMQGGAVQGIGWALNEEYYYDDKGRMANSSFLDYRIPTTLDVPMIETIIVEVPNPLHPYGVRGVGEPRHRPAARRHRERGLPRDRRPPDAAADVARGASSRPRGSSAKAWRGDRPHPRDAPVPDRRGGHRGRPRQYAPGSHGRGRAATPYHPRPRRRRRRNPARSVPCGGRRGSLRARYAHRR